MPLLPYRPHGRWRLRLLEPRYLVSRLGPQCLPRTSYLTSLAAPLGRVGAGHTVSAPFLDEETGPERLARAFSQYPKSEGFLTLLSALLGVA